LKKYNGAVKCFFEKAWRGKISTNSSND
jgi:hypothetical protein